MLSCGKWPRKPELNRTEKSNNQYPKCRPRYNSMPSLLNEIHSPMCKCLGGDETAANIAMPCLIEVEIRHLLCDKYGRLRLGRLKSPEKAKILTKLLIQSQRINQVSLATKALSDSDSGENLQRSSSKMGQKMSFAADEGLRLDNLVFYLQAPCNYSPNGPQAFAQEEFGTVMGFPFL